MEVRDDDQGHNEDPMALPLVRPQISSGSALSVRRVLLEHLQMGVESRLQEIQHRAILHRRSERQEA
jgi:hypothetical protein